MKPYTIELTDKDKLEIENIGKQLKKAQLLRRIQCIKLKDMKWANIKIAEFLGVSSDTITNWLKAYNQGGFDGLLNWDYKGRVSVLTLDQQEILKDRNKEKPFDTAKEAKEYIKEEFGMDFHLHYVQKLLKKNFNFHTKKPD
jgi:transposase